MPGQLIREQPSGSQRKDGEQTRIHQHKPRWQALLRPTDPEDDGAPQHNKSQRQIAPQRTVLRVPKANGRWWRNRAKDTPEHNGRSRDDNVERP
jgi:hypothetical protein